MFGLVETQCVQTEMDSCLFRADSLYSWRTPLRGWEPASLVCISEFGPVTRQVFPLICGEKFSLSPFLGVHSKSFLSLFIVCFTTATIQYHKNNAYCCEGKLCIYLVYITNSTGSTVGTFRPSAPVAKQACLQWLLCTGCLSYIGQWLSRLVSRSLHLCLTWVAN